MGSVKNCRIVRGRASGNIFFDRSSRSEGGRQTFLVGAKVGRRCRSSRLCCEGLQVGRLASGNIFVGRDSRSDGGWVSGIIRDLR